MTRRRCPNAPAYAPPPALDTKEAIDIARSIAERHGWPWGDPVNARFVRLVERKPEWQITAQDVYVVIDDASGQVFVKKLVPRRKWERRRDREDPSGPTE